MAALIRGLKYDYILITSDFPGGSTYWGFNIIIFVIFDSLDGSTYWGPNYY